MPIVQKNSLEVFMKCSHCNTDIGAGMCHYEHQNNGSWYHMGCFAAACKLNIVLKLICKVRCA